MVATSNSNRTSPATSLPTAPIMNKLDQILLANATFDLVHATEISTNAPALRGHILFEHFNSAVLTAYGVPRSDFEIIYLKGESAQWIIDKLTSLLEGKTVTSKTQRRTDGDLVTLDLKDPLTHQIPSNIIDLVIHSIKYAELLGIAQADWGRIENTVPYASRIGLKLSSGPLSPGGFIDQVRSDCLEGRALTDSLVEHIADRFGVERQVFAERLRTLEKKLEAADIYRISFAEYFQSIGFRSENRDYPPDTIPLDSRETPAKLISYLERASSDQPYIDSYPFSRDGFGTSSIINYLNEFVPTADGFEAAPFNKADNRKLAEQRIMDLLSELPIENNNFDQERLVEIFKSCSSSDELAARFRLDRTSPASMLPPLPKKLNK